MLTRLTETGRLGALYAPCSSFYDFISQNPIGYAIAFLMLVATVKKKDDWEDRLCYLLVFVAWILFVVPAVNQFKSDWRSIGITVAIATAIVLFFSKFIWPINKIVTPKPKETAPKAPTRLEPTPAEKECCSIVS